jgi:predicted acetyltransferase
MADLYPIRPVGPEEYDAFHVVMEQAFFTGPPNERRRAALMRHIEFDRTLAAFDGVTPVGSAGIWSLDLCLPGAMAPAAGVTLVAVKPTHRRRGILSSLMRRQLADIRERGEAVAILWSSEAEIYGRFGYGPATWSASFRFERGDGALRRDVLAGLAGSAGADAGGLRLRIVEPGTVRAELGKVYQAVLPDRPGMYARDNPAWWDRLLRTNDDITNEAGTPRCVLAEDDHGPRGYAIYTAKGGWSDETDLPDGSLNVTELVAADPAATALLWGNLLSRDLINEYTASLRPVDDPLIHLLAGPRRARRRVADALWVRLTDVPRALELRRYACPVDVVIEVTDALLPENSGRWRLVCGQGMEPGGGQGFGAACSAAGDRAADLTLDVATLGAAYLGGTRLGPMAGAGLVREHRPGVVAALSAALSWDPAPWCPQIF